MKKFVLAVCTALLSVAPLAIMAADSILPYPPTLDPFAGGNYGTVAAHDPLDGGKLKTYSAAVPPINSLQDLVSFVAKFDMVQISALDGGGIQVIVHQCGPRDVILADARLFSFAGKVSQYIVCGNELPATTPAS